NRVAGSRPYYLFNTTGSPGEKGAQKNSGDLLKLHYGAVINRAWLRSLLERVRFLEPAAWQAGRIVNLCVSTRPCQRLKQEFRQIGREPRRPTHYNNNVDAVLIVERLFNDTLDLDWTDAAGNAGRHVKQPGGGWSGAARPRGRTAREESSAGKELQSCYHDSL